MDIRKMGPTDQPNFHGIFHRADRVYGFSPIPTRARREYELRKRDLWRGHTCEHCPIVRLREENLLGTGEGGP